MSDESILHDISFFKTGWLTKQSKYSKKWKKAWFKLETSELLYAKNEKGPFKSISLSNTVIEESHVMGREHVFKLTSLKNNREIMIQAPSQDEEQMWMQAICFAKVGAQSDEQKTVCSIQ